MQAILTMLAYLVARMSEVSTANTFLAWIAAQIGLHLNPQFNTLLVQVVAGIFALIGFALKDEVFAAAPKKVKALYGHVAEADKPKV